MRLKPVLTGLVTCRAALPATIGLSLCVNGWASFSVPFISHFGLTVLCDHDNIKETPDNKLDIIFNYNEFISRFEGQKFL